MSLVSVFYTDLYHIQSILYKKDLEISIFQAEFYANKKERITSCIYVFEPRNLINISTFNIHIARKKTLNVRSGKSLKGPAESPFLPDLLSARPPRDFIFSVEHYMLHGPFWLQTWAVLVPWIGAVLVYGPFSPVSVWQPERDIN